MRNHVPKDQLEPGLWFIHTDYKPFYEVVSILRYALGPQEGELGVWSIDHEGSHGVDDYDDDQFICRVEAPEGIRHG